MCYGTRTIYVLLSCPRMFDIISPTLILGNALHAWRSLYMSRERHDYMPLTFLIEGYICVWFCVYIHVYGFMYIYIYQYSASD